MPVFPSHTAYRDAGFFLLRSSTLPLSEFARWNQGKVGREGADVLLDLSLKEDSYYLADLCALLQDTFFCDALYFASPSLLTRALALATPSGADSKGTPRAEAEKIYFGLAKYFTRMSTRSTPFGLFAGVSLGKISSGDDEATDLKLGDRSLGRVHLKLDTGYVVSLLAELLSDPTLQQNLKVRPNSSLYALGQEWRYVERYWRGQEQHYRLTAVQQSDALKQILKLAESGYTLADLLQHAVALLVPETTTSIPEDSLKTPVKAITDFISTLIAEQLLVFDIGYPITATAPLDHLIQELIRAGFCHESRLGLLQRWQRTLQEMSSRPWQPGDHQKIAQLIQASEAIFPTVKPKDWVHADWYQSAASPQETLRCHARVVQELTDFIAAAYPALAENQNQLQEYSRAFRERYGERAVPLLTLLDEDVGLRFGRSRPADMPLLHNLRFGDWDYEQSTTMSALDRQLLSRVAEALASGAEEIEFTAADFAKVGEVQQNRALLPQELAAFFTLLASNQAAIDQGNYQLLLHHFSGPPGASLIGRFGGIHPELTAALQQYTTRAQAASPMAEAEQLGTQLQSPLYAEIVHLPSGRLGNVLLRPPLTDYEITYLGYSALPQAQQIHAQDLLVRYQGDRLILWSQKHQREIIPRLTSAHNFGGKNLPVYQFLCALQSQNTSMLRFRWGSVLTENFPFLPRARFGRMILAPARWLLRKSEIESFVAAREDSKNPQELWQAWASLRTKRRLPEQIQLVEGDNLLPIDLSNPLAQALLISEIKGRPFAILQEVLLHPGNSPVHSPAGSHAHEIVLPLYCPQRSQVTATSVETIAAAQHHGAAWQRQPHYPGSHCLYLKIYTGLTAQDRVLTDLILPWLGHIGAWPNAEEGQSSPEVVSHWFFLRYQDPEPHLRLRLFALPGQEPALYAHLANFNERMQQGIAGSAFVHKILLDTYEPETVRYGGLEALPLSEALFHDDSHLVLQWLQLLGKAPNSETDRWQLAAWGIYQGLCDFLPDPSQRAAMIKRQAEAYDDEFRLDKAKRIQLGNHYRTLRAFFEAVVRSAANEQTAKEDFGAPVPSLSSYRSALRMRTQASQPKIKALQNLARQGTLTNPYPSIALSHAHLFATRLLPSEARRQEWLIYHFLARALHSLERQQGSLHKNQSQEPTQ